MMVNRLEYIRSFLREAISSDLSLQILAGAFSLHLIKAFCFHTSVATVGINISQLVSSKDSLIENSL